MYRNPAWCVSACSLILVIAVAAASSSEKHSLGDFRDSVLPVSTNTSNPDDAASWGTAFVVDSKGTMLTADHVVRALQGIVAARSPEKVSLMVTAQQSNSRNLYQGDLVTVVSENEDLDVAILRYSGPHDYIRLSPLELDDRTDIPVGESVQIVGYPSIFPYEKNEAEAFTRETMPVLVFALQSNPIVTFTQVGGITGLLTPPSEKTNWHMNTKEDFLTLDHPGAPGNSGGPVISARTGKVVGMFVRTHPLGYSFAVRAKDLKKVLVGEHPSEPRNN
jgi:S1-C subfamily serine protease